MTYNQRTFFMICGVSSLSGIVAMLFAGHTIGFMVSVAVAAIGSFTCYDRG